MTPERIAMLRQMARDDMIRPMAAHEMLNEIERLQKLAEEILEDFQCAYMHVPSVMIRKWKLVEADERYQKALFS